MPFPNSTKKRIFENKYGIDWFPDEHGKMLNVLAPSRRRPSRRHPVRDIILDTYRKKHPEKKKIVIKKDKEINAQLRKNLLNKIGKSETYIDDVLTRLGNKPIYKAILVDANGPKRDKQNYSDITPDVIQKLSTELQDKNIKIIFDDKIIEEKAYDSAKPLVFLIIEENKKKKKKWIKWMYLFYIFYMIKS